MLNEGQVVFVIQILDRVWDCDTYDIVKGTVLADYTFTVAVNINNRKHYISTDIVYSSELEAVEAIASREQSRAELAERRAKFTRKSANSWLQRLEELTKQPPIAS